MKKLVRYFNQISNKSWFSWLVWGLAATAFFAEYIARVAPSVIVPLLMRDFQVTALALGSLSAYFYYAYVSMQIPVGILVDRFGAHRLLTTTVLLCAGGCLLFAMAHHLWIAKLGRFLMGLGASFAFVSALKLASVWFPPNRFGLLAGLTQALGMLGAAVSATLVGYLVTVMGWRSSLALIALLFVFLSVMIGLVVRDYPQGYQRKYKDLAIDSDVWAGLRTVLANPQSWLNGLFAGVVYAPTAAFGELWGVSFLERTYNLDAHSASMAVGLIFIGWGLGGPVVGWLSDYIGRRKPIMLASAGVGFVLLLIVLYAPSMPLVILYSLLFFYGISNTGVATAYAVASEINPHEVAGTSLAFSNMASVLVGACFQPIIGWLLDLHWNGYIVNGVPFYSAMEFRNALLALPCCLLLGFIFALLLRETYCKTHNQCHS
jgi:MFS family permease